MYNHFWFSGSAAKLFAQTNATNIFINPYFLRGTTEHASIPGIKILQTSVFAFGNACQRLLSHKYQ